MPRTQILCINCKRSIPAKETKAHEAVLLSGYKSDGSEFKLWFCKQCGIEHQLGQYKDIQNQSRREEQAKDQSL